MTGASRPPRRAPRRPAAARRRAARARAAGARRRRARRRGWSAARCAISRSARSRAISISRRPRLPGGGDDARASAAGFGVAPTGLAHGTVTVDRRGQADRSDDAAPRRRNRRAPRQGRVRARLRAPTRSGAISPSTRSRSDRDGDGARLRRRPRRSRRSPGALHRRAAPAHPRGLSAHLAVLPLLRPLRQGALDAEGLRAAIAEREGLAILSRERVRAELLKLLVAPRAAAMVVTAICEAGLLVAAARAMTDPARFAPPGGDRGGARRRAGRRAASGRARRARSSRTPSGCANGCASPTPNSSASRRSPRGLPGLHGVDAPPPLGALRVAVVRAPPAAARSTR